MTSPLDRQIGTLSQTGMTRFFRRLFDDYPDLLMKDQTVDEIGPDRAIKLGGRWVTKRRDCGSRVGVRCGAGHGNVGGPISAAAKAAPRVTATHLPQLLVISALNLSVSWRPV